MHRTAYFLEHELARVERRGGDAVGVGGAGDQIAVRAISCRDKALRFALSGMNGRAQQLIDMTNAFASYVLCGTPRSGSTLLCEMLAATGVAGRPNSYFRREDIEEWADAWKVPHPHGIDCPGFDDAYLTAMCREGRAETGVFGLRLMWASVADATRRLNRALGTDRDIVQSIEAAFGPALYIHISRRDKIAQAVSLARAEQSGLWHLAADGTVPEGGETVRSISYDGARIAEFVREFRSDDASWSAFFEERGINPLRLVYETVTADPNAALQQILIALNLDPKAAKKSIPVPTAKMADNESDVWIERFQRENGVAI